MRNSQVGVFVLGMFLLSVGCLEDAPSKNETAKSATAESADLETFYAVRIGISASTVIESGEDQSYRIEATETDLEKITVGVRKGSLVFGIKRGERLADQVRIFIVGSGLESVQLSGSGRLEAEDGTLKKSESTVVLSGSGTVRVDGENMTELTAILSGSGTIDLSGKGQKLDVVVSGSGDVKALDFNAKEVKINLSGSGNCEVDAERQLNAAITGSGNIRFSGDPEVRKRITGSGKVERINS